MAQLDPRVDKLLALLLDIDLRIAMKLEELALRLTTVSAQVAKIGVETAATLAAVASLKDALAAAGTTTPEVDAALAALEAQTQKVDDLVPDALPQVDAPVVETPAVETPAVDATVDTPVDGSQPAA